jgi:hypothetical protein
MVHLKKYSHGLRLAPSEMPVLEGTTLLDMRDGLTREMRPLRLPADILPSFAGRSIYSVSFAALSMESGTSELTGITTFESSTGIAVLDLLGVGDLDGRFACVVDSLMLGVPGACGILSADLSSSPRDGSG